MIPLHRELLNTTTLLVSNWLDMVNTLDDPVIVTIARTRLHNLITLVGVHVEDVQYPLSEMPDRVLIALSRILVLMKDVVFHERSIEHSEWVTHLTTLHWAINARV